MVATTTIRREGAANRKKRIKKKAIPRKHCHIRSKLKDAKRERRSNRCSEEEQSSLQAKRLLPRKRRERCYSSPSVRPRRKRIKAACDDDDDDDATNHQPPAPSREMTGRRLFRDDDVSGGQDDASLDLGGVEVAFETAAAPSLIDESEDPDAVNNGPTPSRGTTGRRRARDEVSGLDDSWDLSTIASVHGAVSSGIVSQAPDAANRSPTPSHDTGRSRARDDMNGLDDNSLDLSSIVNVQGVE
eukprot:CAMPEP_0172492400 /NCGR_PEP_ID=MMETSP1066-20121228/23554_1 /TAXON_ID=671091 /ORGANISM="Coscinodiscus wailesii, Strain CCMP2513" /LENGTH=243 /DNA_ID=CAMNT_0013262015 /DNA_START=127 /DNA_END=855 /DNA_ORIENTATION=+